MNNRDRLRKKLQEKKSQRTGQIFRGDEKTSDLEEKLLDCPGVDKASLIRLLNQVKSNPKDAKKTLASAMQLEGPSQDRSNNADTSNAKEEEGYSSEEGLPPTLFESV